MEYYQIKYLVLVEGLHTVWAAGSKGPGMTFYSTFIICSVLERQWYSTTELSTRFVAMIYLYIHHVLGTPWNIACYNTCMRSSSWWSSAWLTQS